MTCWKPGRRPATCSSIRDSPAEPSPPARPAAARRAPALAKGQRHRMPPVLRKIIAEWRNRIETTFQEITDQMELTRHGAHTFWGLVTAPPRSSPPTPSSECAWPVCRSTHITRLRAPTASHRRTADAKAATLRPLLNHPTARTRPRRNLRTRPSGLRQAPAGTLLLLLTWLLLGPPAEVPGQEALGGGIEAQPVLRLGEAVPLVREQHVLMVDPGRHQGRDDLL